MTRTEFSFNIDFPTQERRGMSSTEIFDDAPRGITGTNVARFRERTMQDRMRAETVAQDASFGGASDFHNDIAISVNELSADLSSPNIETAIEPDRIGDVRMSDARMNDDRAKLRAAAERIWKLCLETIRPQLSAQTMRTWFEPLEAIALEGSEITLRAPSSFFCEWIGEHYQDILEQSLRDVLGATASFRFDTTEIPSAATKLQASVEPQPAPARPALDTRSNVAMNGSSSNGSSPREQPAFTQQSYSRPASPAATQQNPFGHPGFAPAAPGAKRPPIETNLNPRYTFDTFIRGESNKLAYAAAMAVANNPGGTRYNPLVIYGSVGLGKTHLIQAIGNAALQKFPSARVLYTSSDKFTVEFVDSIQNNKSNEFQALYRSIDVLIIDDVQFFAGKEKTQDIFFHTFNALRELGKQIILTCDRPPRVLKDIDDRLLNRLQ
ncbi:MAG TPA: DnaA/Hda family protein, partial [Candidatus Kapabacteria bacterium]